MKIFVNWLKSGGERKEENLTNLHVSVYENMQVYTVIHKKRGSTYVVITLEKLDWFFK